MTRRAKGAPFQMRSGNATPFKNMGSSYVQPTRSPIQNEGSPVKQIGTLIKKAAKYAPGITKYVKGLFSKSDDIVETVKKVEKGLKNPKSKKVTVKSKPKPKGNTKTNTKTNTKKTDTKKTDTFDPTKRDLDIKVDPKKTELKLNKDGSYNKNSKIYKDIFKAGKESTVPTPKFPKLNKGWKWTKAAAQTAGFTWAGNKIYNMATDGSGSETDLSVKDIGGYLDEPNKLITSEGDTLDLSKNVIKKGDY